MCYCLTAGSWATLPRCTESVDSERAETDDSHQTIVFLIYRNILCFLRCCESEDPSTKQSNRAIESGLRMEIRLTCNWICNCRQRTSISNFRFNLKSGVACISARIDIIPMSHGLGCWKIYVARISRPIDRTSSSLTLLRAHDSKIFDTNGITYNNSCEPVWYASITKDFISKSCRRKIRDESERWSRRRTVAKIGLFFAIVIIPSQWPRFFNNDRSGILFICLSLTRRIWKQTNDDDRRGMSTISLEYFDAFLWERCHRAL